MTAPEALRAGTLVVPETVSVVPRVEAVRPTLSTEVAPRSTVSKAAPDALAVPLTARPTTLSSADSTCNCAVGTPVPTPIWPSGVMVRRGTSSSTGRVENTIGLAAPRAVSVTRPLLAVMPRLPLLAVSARLPPDTPGAPITSVADSEVNAPEARPPLPMGVLLIAPPVISALSVWN